MTKAVAKNGIFSSFIYFFGIFLQVLKDASQDHLTIHHQDIMTFDMVSPLVNSNTLHKKEWETHGMFNL